MQEYVFKIVQWLLDLWEFSVKKKGEGCQRQMNHNFKKPCFDRLGASTSHTGGIPSSFPQAYVKNINFSKYQLLFIHFSHPMSSSLFVCGLSRMPSIDVHEVRAPIYLTPEVKARLRQSLLKSNYEHKIAIVKIPTQRSRPYCTTMQRSFSTQISGNRRPRAELLEVARARIIAASEAGLLKLEIAVDYHVNRLTIYDTINQWKSHYTLKSLPRSR